MVGIQEVRAELTTLKRLGPGLVGVFVGGTSGIGESTAREFARYAVSPRIYLVGRSQEQADRIKSDFQTLNPQCQTKFIQGDVSLLRNVDKICDEIKASENKINLLFLSAGLLTMKGRNGELPQDNQRTISYNV
jgi:short-subunit dehydrogenase